MSRAGRLHDGGSHNFLALRRLTTGAVLSHMPHGRRKKGLRDVKISKHDGEKFILIHRVVSEFTSSRPEEISATRFH